MPSVALYEQSIAMANDTPGNAMVRKAGADLVNAVRIAVQCMDTTTIGDVM